MNEAIAIIMGYGVPPDILNDGNYRHYLATALYSVILPKNIQHIVLCGGRTNIHYPEKTEAAEMLRLLQNLLPDPPPALTHDLVADSITGWENLEGATMFVCVQWAETIYILCEKTRRAKVWLTAKLTFARDVNIKVVGIDFDATHNWHRDWKQYLGVLVVAAEYVFPGLRRLTRRRQLRHIKRVSQK